MFQKNLYEKIIQQRNDKQFSSELKKKIIINKIITCEIVRLASNCKNSAKRLTLNVIQNKWGYRKGEEIYRIFIFSEIKVTIEIIE